MNSTVIEDEVILLWPEGARARRVGRRWRKKPSCRPAFAAPIYAAVFEDVVAPADAPALFLLCANDDDMATAACLRLYSAWKAVSRPVEMHIYSKGGHGFGMTHQGLPSDTWIERFGDWLQVQGLFERPA